MPFALAWINEIITGTLRLHKYEITAERDGTFVAKVMHPHGRVETARGFPTKEAALEWVGERITVDKDTAT